MFTVTLTVPLVEDAGLPVFILTLTVPVEVDPVVELPPDEPPLELLDEPLLDEEPELLELLEVLPDEVPLEEVPVELLDELLLEELFEVLPVELFPLELDGFCVFCSGLFVTTGFGFSSGLVCPVLPELLAGVGDFFSGGTEDVGKHALKEVIENKIKTTFFILLPRNDKILLSEKL